MDNSLDKESICNEKGTEDKDDHRHLELEELKAVINALESEKKKSDEQFGVQRGKMKELFLQNEEERKRLSQEVEKLRKELDDARSEITVAGLNLEGRLEEERLKAQEEVSSLQQLLSTTLEEGSKTEGELKALKARNEKLEAELIRVSGEGSASGGGPQILTAPGAVLTTIARKVATHLGGSDSQNQPETLEDSMRKAKEDAEVLRSLVVPLEQEISALKNKLRETDSQLRRYQALDTNISSPSGDTLSVPQSDRTSGSSSTEDISTTLLDAPKPKGKCDMCSNYETQLVSIQIALAETRKMAERAREELDREAACRKQMEIKWQEKKEQHKAQVAELEKKLNSSERMLEELRKAWHKTRIDIDSQFKVLREERHTTQSNLEKIQQENENLMGKYNANSQALQDEEINLPDSVEAMQEMWLRSREDLIRARVGKERLEEFVQTLECLLEDSAQKREELDKQLTQLREEKCQTDKLLSDKENKMKDQEGLLGILRHEITELRSVLQNVNREKKLLEDNEANLKSRLVSLQTGLENGEAVQKDFVLLSQSLQKELEHLRAQNNVLRWEYEEDVSECRGCEQSFKSLSKGKYNCRHCGRIFCGQCLSHRVRSGPSCRESKVCDMCHTLLNKDTPPYFSTDPPHHAK